MLNPEKVATPATAATVLVPDRVPVLGFVPIATVMFPVNPLAVLPPASWAVTSTAGVIAVAAVVVLGCTENPLAVLPPASWAVTSTAGVITVAAVVVLGCTENTSCVAVPAVMLNAALIPVTRSEERRVGQDPALSMLNPEKVATPATAGKVLVPDRVPVLRFVPIAAVMSAVNPLAVLPPASWAVTSTAGVIAVAAVVVLGCTENTSCVAVPAVMLNAALIPVT